MSGGTADPRLDYAGDASKFYGNLMKGGLPASLREKLQSQLAGNIRGAEMSLSDTFAGRNLSAGATSGALSDIRSRLGSEGALGIADRDFAARLQGAGGRLSVAGLNNQSELARYQAEKANEFSWGDALGGLLSIGGTVLGGPAGGAAGGAAGQALGGAAGQGLSGK